jgi:pimeloyl-ACP methyl ester carboxylesterase
MRGCLAAVVAAGVWSLAQAGWAAPGDTIYENPGVMAPAGDGASLNLTCAGSGSPTVVFESGWEDWAPAWAVVQPRIATFTRACSYDRAGAGFSDPGPMPRTSERIATELHGALHAAGIAGPYILVGHAFGGDNVRAFADLFMDDVAGMVLVDADPADVGSAAQRQRDDRGDLAYIADVRACRDAVAAGKPLPPSSPGSSDTCAQQFFRGLPEAQWSPELNAKLLEIAKSKVAMWDAYISEMQNMPRDEIWLRAHRRSLGARPIRVLTSGNHAVGHLETQAPVSLKHLAYEYEIAVAQSRWLSLSSDARQTFTGHSSEYIQFDQPDVVVDAVRDVYQRSRQAPWRAPPAPGRRTTEVRRRLAPMTAQPMFSRA